MSEMKEILEKLSKEYAEMNGFSRSTLNELRQLCDSVEQHLGITIRKPSARVSDLLRDVALELQKSSNEDAHLTILRTGLLDRIDRILSPILIEPVPPSQTPEDPKVSDFVPAFIEKLIEQLASDHKRWGDTWLKRPREGQEARTKARYDDYFDMFIATGKPVPWLKVIGGALICWIRENHPELCPDVNEVIADDMEKIGLKPVSGVTGKGELIGISVSPEGVEDIRMPEISSETPVPAEEKPMDMEALGKHIQDPSEKCPDCGECEKPVEEMTTKELVGLDLGLDSISHVVDEKIEKSGLGKLSYSPRSDSDGKIILDSVVFTKANVKEYPNEVVTKLGTCDKDGCIIPTSKAVGVLGRVSSNGQYRLTLVKGVGPDDTIYVSYTYEYSIPA